MEPPPDLTPQDCVYDQSNVGEGSGNCIIRLAEATDVDVLNTLQGRLEVEWGMLESGRVSPELPVSPPIVFNDIGIWTRAWLRARVPGLLAEFPGFVAECSHVRVLPCTMPTPGQQHWMNMWHIQGELSKIDSI